MCDVQTSARQGGGGMKKAPDRIDLREAVRRYCRSDDDPPGTVELEPDAPCRRLRKSGGISPLQLPDPPTLPAPPLRPAGHRS